MVRCHQSKRSLTAVSYFVPTIPQQNVTVMQNRPAKAESSTLLGNVEVPYMLDALGLQAPKVRNNATAAETGPA
jgi:hypothetical protein